MNLKNTVLAMSLLAASATAGAAEFYTYTSPTSATGIGNLKNNNSTGPGFAAVSVTGYSTSSARGGQFFGNFWSGPTNPIPPDSFFRFFCAELTQSTTAGPVTYYGFEFSDSKIAKLYDVAYPRNGKDDFWNGAQTNFGVFSAGGGYTAAEYAAAFQVALWNLVLEGDYSLTGGTFNWIGAATNVSNLATQMLNAVNSYAVGDTGYTRWTLYKFISPVPNCTAGTAAACGGNNQDYISATYRFPTPEPGTLALFGLALVGLGAASRKQRRS